jgi:hypothetical protein
MLLLSSLTAHPTAKNQGITSVNALRTSREATDKKQYHLVSHLGYQSHISCLDVQCTDDPEVQTRDIHAP